MASTSRLDEHGDDTLELPPLIASYLATGDAPLEASHVEAVYAVGHAFFVREEHGKAIDLFRLLILCRPQDARSWFALGACHEAIGEHERAITLYEVALSAPQGRQEQLRSLVHLAKLLFAEGRLEDAEEAIEEALRRLIDEDDLDLRELVTAMARHVRGRNQ